MIQFLAGGAVVAVSAVFVYLSKTIERLLPDIDDSLYKPLDFEAEETRMVQWVFVPISKRMATGEQPPPRGEIDRVKSTYNALVGWLEILRWLRKIHRDSRRSIQRNLVWSALTMLPFAVLIQGQVIDFIPAVPQTVVLVFVAAAISVLITIVFCRLIDLEWAKKEFVKKHQTLETTLTGLYFQYRPREVGGIEPEA